ncbi:Carboxylesterase [Ancylostoma duodenale]|uniref:Carboxylic ester hydrolase n=1 Tax=Ancylostoma duodenale TaxID=51022 RepID=A0A0C2GH46_9BILA|nr:Carboxylesterase [Ancylostoma duodenale]
MGPIKPQRLEPWDGVKKCKQFGNRSVQDDMFWDKFTINTPQSEDCLYLNIFAPAIDPVKSYPVMCYIHGGGFMMDSAVRYKPDKMARLLVSHGVVVVTIQYRLGYLGYFCTGDDVAKGNYGLWDQLEALKWTKENIHHFGGDPNRITVAGQSAGAVSTDLLSLSPLSRDMFHRKIVMGGSTFCYWSTTTKEKCAEYCRQKALKLGWKPRGNYTTHEEESKDLLEFMRTVPAHNAPPMYSPTMAATDTCNTANNTTNPPTRTTLHIPVEICGDGGTHSSDIIYLFDCNYFTAPLPMNKTDRVVLGMHMIGNRVFFDEARLPLTPVVDGEILPKEIHELRAEAPTMESICGVGQQESLLFCALGAIRGTGKDMDKVVRELARKTELSVSEVEGVMGRLYGDLKELRKNSKAMQEAYVTCTSDVFSNYGCYRYMQHSQQHDKPTYAYYFTHTSRNMWGWLATVVPFLGGTHSSDIIYLFDCNYFTAPLPMNKTDRVVSKMTSTAFMEFVKTGNPNTPEVPFTWEPVSKSGEMRMLEFSEKPSMTGKIFDNRMQRLQNLIKELLPRKLQSS